jgi:excisionase family DNA binding protein
MKLRQAVADHGSPSLPAPRAPQQVLTLEEAARAIGISLDELRRDIRSGRIPFTLASGRSGEGMLIYREDLARLGLVHQPHAQPLPRNSSLPAREQVRRGTNPVTRPRMSPLRIGAYTGTAIATAITLFLLVLLFPLVVRPSDPVSAGLSGSRGRTCALRSNRADCSTGHPRSGSSAATRSAGRPTTIVARPGSTTRSGLPSRINETSPAPGSAGGTVPSPSPPPPPNGYSTPPKIPSNCSRDVTADLLQWIGTVPDNSTLLFPQGACYRIDGTMRINNRVGLTFQGNGTTFSGKFHSQGKAPHWGLYASRGITFRDMTVRGANPHAGLYDDAYQPALQWEAAWEIDGSVGVLLDTVQAYDVFGDFVTIEPMWIDHGPVNSRNVIVKNSRFERNGRSGIDITGAQDVTISNNYIGNIRHALFSMEPEWPTMPIDHIEFTGNRTGGVWLLWIANGGICNAAVSNVHVADNLMEAGAGMPLFHVNPPSGCPRRGPFTIERNTLIARSSPYASIDFTQVRDSVVRDNNVVFLHDPRPRVLVDMALSTRVSVLDNRVSADPRDTVRFVTADPGSDYVESGNVRV